MARLLKVRRPKATEMRPWRDVLEESPNARVRRWAETLLGYGAGLNAPQIAAAFADHVNTIYNGLNNFARTRLAFLQSLRPPGVRSRITVAQLDEIARIAEQSPTEFGWP